MQRLKKIDAKMIRELNPNKEPLTVEKLKTFKGFENIDDEKAQETVFAIQTLAAILYEYTMEQQVLKEREKINNNNEPIKIAA